jgi:hypothetical protein
MINEILAFWTPGPIELIVILVIFSVVFVIPTTLVVLFIIYLVKNNKERLRLRMEVEKLTEEINKLKQEKP